MHDTDTRTFAGIEWTSAPAYGITMWRSPGFPSISETPAGSFKFGITFQTWEAAALAALKSHRRNLAMARKVLAHWDTLTDEQRAAIEDL